MGRSRYKIFEDDSSPYFLTCTVVKWIAVFGYPEIARVILDSLHFLIKNNRLSLYGYVIMEHHLHLIASAKDLVQEMRSFKSYTARMIIDFLHENRMEYILKQLEFYKKQHKKSQHYQLWQEGSHPQMIQDREMLNQKLEYMHYNPVRSGYVDDPMHWRYSSCRDYYGKDGLLPVVIL